MPLFSKLFPPRTPSKGKDPGEVYSGLRNLILTKRKPSFDGFWGIVMDIGVPNGHASMIAVADGTISLYTSGGGIIGVGPHEGPKKVAAELLHLAPQFSEYCHPTSEYPLPSAGNTRFYLMGPSATVTAEFSSSELGSGKHVLSPLFLKCHELLTEIRNVDAKLRAKLPKGSS
jgi:hypothetical protein